MSSRVTSARSEPSAGASGANRESALTDRTDYGRVAYVTTDAACRRDRAAGASCAPCSRGCNGARHLTRQPGHRTRPILNALPAMIRRRRGRSCEAQGAYRGGSGVTGDHAACGIERLTAQQGCGEGDLGGFH